MNENDRPGTTSPLPLAAIAARAAAVGLGVRGAFHLSAEDAPLLAENLETAGTCVLLGFTGSMQWPHFASSLEAGDGEPHPLDRWSRRLIGALGREFGASALYPSSEPHVPFQRLAARAESVHPSPIGLLIHPVWGLWHAYRGALVFPVRIEIPVRREAPSPCASCVGKPCVSTCPVGAFGAGGFNLPACLSHVTSSAGTECRERGCLARRACPIAPGSRYVTAQMRFHTEAFIRSASK